MNVKAVLQVLILSFFILGQLGTTAHAHEIGHTHDHHHEDENDKRQSLCDLCILAVTEEDVLEALELPDILDGPDVLNISTALAAYQIHTAEIMPLCNGRKPASLNRLIDAARAPPFN